MILHIYICCASISQRYNFLVFTSILVIFVWYLGTVWVLCYHLLDILAASIKTFTHLNCIYFRTHKRLQVTEKP